MHARHDFATGPTNRSMPEVTVIPVLHYADVRSAVAQLCACFGFAERLQIGDHRVQLTVGSGSVVAAKASGPHSGPAHSNHSVMVRVVDVDAHCAMARQAGATILAEPATFPYGERQYSAVDPGGHVWTFSQTVHDADPGSWGGVLVRSSGSEG
jgi:uncharacterized glyoxalase superfamily protein PhnB